MKCRGEPNITQNSLSIFATGVLNDKGFFAKDVAFFLKRGIELAHQASLLV
jgi:hypothetical protein